MKQEFRLRPLAALIVGSVMFAPVSAIAAEQAGVLLVSSGGVKAIDGSGNARDLNRKSAVYSGDKLKTGSGARAQIKFTDGAIVGLRPNSELRIDEYSYTGDSASKSFMSLLKGGFRTVSGAIGKAGGGDYKVTTPVATIGIRGTLWDGEYDPETGLDLAVWDGGISACAAAGGGCLDLGGDVDYRYGHVSPDGTMTGLKESPIDEDEDDEGNSGAEYDTVFDQQESDMLDEDITLFLPSDHLSRERYPLAGFGVASGSRFPSSLLHLDFARFDSAAYMANAYGGWGAFRESSTGQFLIPGSRYEICDGECYVYDSGFSGSVQEITLGQDPDTDIIWGYWNYNGMSLSGSDGDPTLDALDNYGLFVLGYNATPAVVATLTGNASFTLSNLQILDSSGSPSTVSGTGSLSMNMDTGSAYGGMSFQDTGFDSWTLDFSGTVSNDGLSLAMLTDTANATNASYYMSYGGAVTAPVQGTVEASFVGQTFVEAVIGGFQADAVDAVDPTTVIDSVKGVFVMPNDNPPVIIVTEPPAN
ncbi:MAG: FecR family protein [Pseudomonadota bacterium]